MAHKNDDWKKVDAKAKQEGYRVATSFNGYVKDDGSKVLINGGSVKVNGTDYTDWRDTKKSNDW